MRMRRRPELARTMLLAAVAATAAILLLAGTGQGAGQSTRRAAARAWHSVFGDRPAARPGKPMIVGIYPVRAAYPAQTSGPRRPGVGSGIRLPGFDGRGVRVALLDTGVDRSHPDLEGRGSRGFDLVRGHALADAEANPNDAAQLELHGTRMAGLVLRVAPRARIL